MATVGTAFDPRRNNFDAIRLGAALVVLVSHSYALTGRPEYEVFHLWLGDSEFGGTLAVGVFFVISGFLVTRSATEHDTLEYLRSRVLRIVPAIAILCVFEVALVGLAFTTLPRSAYLSDPETLRTFSMSLFLASARAYPVFSLQIRIRCLTAPCGRCPSSAFAIWLCQYSWRLA